jgi:hypothetical protein
MSDATEALMRALLSTIARQTFPEKVLREIVVSRTSGESQLQAFNMCDGTKTQSQIAKAQGLDAGNFSRTVARWVEAGIVFRLRDGSDEKLLHVYPLPKEATPQKERSK